MENKCSITALTRDDTTIIRGIAIMLVLLGHICLGQKHFISWGGGFGVSLFLMVSGYGINESARKGVDDYWIKRIKAVYIPYLFVAVWSLLFFGCDGKDQLVCTLLGLDFCRNADGTMWYISYIFYWYLVYYATFRISRRIENENLRCAVKLAGLLIMAPVCKLFCYDTVWGIIGGGFWYIWHFPLGVVLSDLSKLKIRKSVNTMIWTAALAVCTIRILYVFPNLGYHERFSVPMFFVALIRLIKSRGIILNAFRWIGKYSYPIYLLEGIFVLRNRNIFFGWLPHPILADATAIAVTVILSVLYWELIYKEFLIKIPVEKLSPLRAIRRRKSTVR